MGKEFREFWVLSFNLRLAFDFQQDTTVRKKRQTGLPCYCENGGFFLWVQMALILCCVLWWYTTRNDFLGISGSPSPLILESPYILIDDSWITSLHLSTSSQTHHNPKTLLVEIELIGLLCSLDLTGVSVLKIGLNNVVSVLPYCSQTSLLHNCCNNSST